MSASPEVRLAKSEEFLTHDKVYEAIKELETLIQEHPTHFPAHVQLGLLNFRLGAIARGRDYMQKALAVAPTPQDHHKIKAILREQDKLDQKRLYRPDFEALNKRAAPTPSLTGNLIARLKAYFQR